MAAHLGVRIDVNRAAVDDWLRLPGLSIHQARNLVELSRVGVRFYCIEDMAAALSISVHRLKYLEVILNFSYYEDEDTTKDDCLSNPCKNNATCSDDGESYTCLCPEGYSGTDCENGK